jgi:hypothetical protein
LAAAPPRPHPGGHRLVHDGEKARAAAGFEDRHRMEGLPDAAVDQAGKGDVEQFGDVAADDVGAVGKAELEQGAAGGGQHLAGDAQGDRAFAQGADEFGPVMEAQDVIVAELVQEHAVLDHLHRHADQGQRVLLGQARFAGGVEHADELAFMVEDRRGRAGQADIPRQVVFVLVHGDRAPLEQAGAHAVGALRAFAPHRAGHQAGLGGRMGEGGVAEVIEQHAVAVGQHDRIAGTGQLLVQVGHLDLGDGLHIGQPFLALLQFGSGPLRDPCNCRGRAYIR